MSTNCHDCGYRDTEVKSGGAISPLGRKITLKVEDTDDLSRDILKVRLSLGLRILGANDGVQSETAGLIIPEIDLELNPGTLGGRFTTLEGILTQVYEELDEKVFAKGDAAAKGEDKMGEFLKKLKQVSLLFQPRLILPILPNRPTGYTTLVKQEQELTKSLLRSCPPRSPSPSSSTTPSQTRTSRTSMHPTQTQG